MSILGWFGLVLLALFSFSLIMGGLLNLGECGDRIGEKYKTSNYCQIVVGVFLAVLCVVVIK
jgi:hypothetical protein